MRNFHDFIKNFLLTTLLTFVFFGSHFAQDKFDLDVKVQPASETARGGETFSYSINIGNIGSAKATDVALLQDEPQSARFVSFAPSKGNCEIDESRGRGRRRLRCRLNDIEPSDLIIILVEVKISEFGDVSEDAILRKTMESFYPKSPEFQQNYEEHLGYVDVLADREEENKENNRAKILVKLLPSKNVPPLVQIVSPKNEAVITRSAKKLSKITFTIKAFDSDGTIEKVFVNTQQFAISVEYPENRIIIEGKSYTSKEIEENKELQKYWGGEAIRISKDTYTFTLENPKYGFNNISAEVTDNGGRTSSAYVRLTVKGDNSIEFTKPLKDSVIKPNTDLVIETKSVLNDGGNGKFSLIGNAICCGLPPQMKEISRVGNTFIHRYVWKNISKGNYYLQIMLLEDSGAFTYSDGFSFVVTEKPRVKITSLKNGQLFKENEKIPIEIEAVDPDGEVKDVEIFTNGTYEKEFSWNQSGFRKSGRIRFLRKGIYKISAKATDDLKVETESEVITIVVN